MAHFGVLTQIMKLAQYINLARFHRGFLTGAWRPAKKLLLTAATKLRYHSGIPNKLSPHDRRTSVASPNGKKRKRAEDLFPGEIWRAKNVANDYLGLRQPVHNTCLTYMSCAPTQTQILAGTHFGDLRRYDTRSGRRPVSDLKGVGKVGGVKSLEKGLSEHEVFVSDQGTNLFAIDVRAGKVVYGYKGISGAVNSLAIAPSLLASVSLDRFTRIHSTFPPAAEGKQQEDRGTVLEKIYMTTVPTVVIWGQGAVDNSRTIADQDEGDIWEKMKQVGEKNE
ncbi:hypothetical protein JVU11DRAFT_528 [Chiua virens]|nr:hypothetical protein JVU11DRAFT_528 [Chiua virens]